MDVDEVLLRLWDGGIEYPTTPDAIIRSSDIGRARAACGVAPPKDRLSVEYWMRRGDLSREQFTEWAAGRGVRITSNARRLPKGGLARLERALREEASDRQDVAPLRAVEPAAQQPVVRDRLEWRPIGHSRESMRLLTTDDIEAIHFQIANDFAGTADPIAPAGVRERALLDSAAGRPSTGMWGQMKYPTVEMAAAALTHSVIHNHPFFNGNKRTALVSMLAFLDANGLVLTSSQDELFRWTLRIAAHKLGASRFQGDVSDAEVYLMSQWLSQNCRNVENGERVITFVELRRRLMALGCDVQTLAKRGGRVVVERQVRVPHRTLLGTRDRMVKRRFILPYGGDGRQVSRARIKEMRRELHLSEDHGFDSASFYGSDKQRVDAFIAEYRKTLKKLARL